MHHDKKHVVIHYNFATFFTMIPRDYVVEFKEAEQRKKTTGNWHIFNFYCNYYSNFSYSPVGAFSTCVQDWHTIRADCCYPS